MIRNQLIQSLFSEFNYYYKCIIYFVSRILPQVICLYLNILLLFICNYIVSRRFNYIINYFVVSNNFIANDKVFVCFREAFNLIFCYIVTCFNV